MWDNQRDPLNHPNTVERVTGKTLSVRRTARRAGDPSRLVADASAAMSELGWRPAMPGLETIVATAWSWHRTHPKGYDD